MYEFKAILEQGSFSEASWDKLIEQLDGKTVIKYSPFVGDPEVGFISEKTPMGNLVKFIPSMMGLMYTKDIWKDTTAKLTTRRFIIIGTFDASKCSVEKTSYEV